MIQRPTNRFGNVLYLIFIDIPGVVSSNVGTPIETCNNIFVSPVIKTEQTDPEVTSSWPVYLKSRANWRVIESYLLALINLNSIAKMMVLNLLVLLWLK